MANTLRHYLDTHADYMLDENEQLIESLLVKYGYHYSGEHHLREQTLAVPRESLSPDEWLLIKSIYIALKQRIPKIIQPVRLPHATVIPKVRTAYLTFVAQDQRQADILPVARLYYYETVPELASQIERAVRIEKSDWEQSEYHMATRMRAWVRASAWKGYQRLVAPYLHP